MGKREVKGFLKGQISIEYLFMMGFTLLLLIPTIILFASESENIKSDIAAAHATQVARKIADKAEEMYYQGAPSKTTIMVSIPEGIENISFENKEIEISYRTSDNALEDIVQISPINMTGGINCTEGVHNIEIQSEGDYVSISEN